MALAAGTRLGPYAVVAPLGVGGMGEVYRARDTKLGRDVALKILPAQFADDPERLARFEREAKTLAALNHPHIAHIHGFEEFRRGGPSGPQSSALVMELVEGQTLAERIVGGPGLQPRPIPIDEALPLAKQLAEALEYAHERGVVHRDLKPANIKITPESAVKVLDFGLAKALDQAPGSGLQAPEVANLPTITSPAMPFDVRSGHPEQGRGVTRAGVILGTAAYMSPEQARGATGDKRADIWAFGVVLYEMLTGRAAFPGETLTDVLGAVVHKEPEWSALPAETPWRVRDLLRRCLTKDRKQRLRDIGDARLEIEEAIARGSSGTGAESPAGSGRTARATHREKLAWALLAASLLALAGVGVALWTGRWSASPAGPGAAELTRLTITLPAGQAVTSPPAISRDGRTIAYTAGLSSEPARLYIRRLDDFVSQAVPATEGAGQPFFSPDGRAVAYFARGRLYRWSLAGGAPQPVADAPAPIGGTWGEDGTIVFVPVWNGGLFRLQPSGGAPEVILRPDPKLAEYAVVFPRFVPGREEVLFTVLGQKQGIAHVDLARRVRSTVLTGANGGTVTTSGHLLFAEGYSPGRSLLAAPYVGGATPGTTRTAVLSGIHEVLWSPDMWITTSSTGTLAYVPSDLEQRTLVQVDQTGRGAPFAEKPGSYSHLALSRDGRRAAVDTIGISPGDEGHGTLWLVEGGRSGRVRLAPENRDADEGMPVWAPDASRVIYASNQPGNWDIYARVVGAATSERLLQKEFDQTPEAMASDGTLAFRETHPTTGEDIWLLPPGGVPAPWLATPATEVHCDFSPDGRWLSYASDASGRFEVYVGAVDGKGPRIQVSTEGGSEPAWSPKGDRLYYRRGATMMSVDVTSRDPLAVGRPRKLFDGGWALRSAELPWMRTYAVLPDGEHFLMIRHEPGAIPDRLNIVLHWFEELKRLVPTK